MPNELKIRMERIHNHLKRLNDSLDALSPEVKEIVRDYHVEGYDIFSALENAITASSDVLTDSYKINRQANGLKPREKDVKINHKFGKPTIS